MNKLDKPDVTILHSPGTVPKVETCETVYAPDSKLYFVPKNEKWTISNTDEQKDEYIKKLEKLIDDERKSKVSETDVLFDKLSLVIRGLESFRSVEAAVGQIKAIQSYIMGDEDE